jgi:aspartyl-tRNA(Asn)/glutamyl-tRNA(Gln) amidotransferase subunit B
MNSFKAVYEALEYEGRRQREAMASGERIVQETRGWVDPQSKTVSQRSKEYAHDYRYFPEPDLPPLNISRTWVDEVNAKLPELPEARRSRYLTAYGLSDYDAALITSVKSLADYYEAALAAPNCQKLSADKRAKEVANWLLGEGTRIMNEANADIDGFNQKISPDALCGLVIATHGAVNNLTAKTVLEEMFKSGKPAGEIIKEKGLGQIGSSAELEKIVDQAVAANKQAVADYKAGKESAVKYLMGQVMRATKGQADPKLTTELLVKKLREM